MRSKRNRFITLCLQILVFVGGFGIASKVLAEAPSLPSPAISETDRTHGAGKFFLRLGLGFGAGLARNSYASPLTSTENLVGYSSDVDILLGTAVASGVILGGGISLYVIPDGVYSATPNHGRVGGWQTLMSAVGFANIYLDRKGGLQLQLFGGVGELATWINEFYEVKDSRGNVLERKFLSSSKKAGLFGLGFGWDAYVSRRWSLGLMLKAMGFVASGKMDEYVLRNVSTTSIGIMPTLGLTATYN